MNSRVSHYQLEPLFFLHIFLQASLSVLFLLQTPFLCFNFPSPQRLNTGKRPHTMPLLFSDRNIRRTKKKRERKKVRPFAPTLLEHFCAQIVNGLREMWTLNKRMWERIGRLRGGDDATPWFPSDIEKGGVGGRRTVGWNPQTLGRHLAKTLQGNVIDIYVHNNQRWRICCNWTPCRMFQGNRLHFRLSPAGVTVGKDKRGRCCGAMVCSARAFLFVSFFFFFFVTM